MMSDQRTQLINVILSFSSSLRACDCGLANEIINCCNTADSLHSRSQVPSFFWRAWCSKCKADFICLSCIFWIVTLTRVGSVMSLCRCTVLALSPASTSVLLLMNLMTFMKLQVKSVQLSQVLKRTNSSEKFKKLYIKT